MRHENAPRRGPGFFDKMLGSGSQATLSRTFKPSPRPSPLGEGTPAPKAGGGEAGSAPRWTRNRVEAVNSGQSRQPRGKKGIGRALLIFIALAWGLTHWKPWGGAKPKLELPKPTAEAAENGSWTQDFAALFIAKTPEDAQRQALEERKQEAADAARLAGLPVEASGGDALALWQDSSGRWWGVNGNGGLNPSPGPAAKDSLGLPELRGVAAQAEEHGQAKRLSLKLPLGLLKQLLPLEPSVASEVRALLLDASDWERRQRRLGLVLADLAAKKRRASLIDLRYEDTAVVRPAGRG